MALSDLAKTILMNKDSFDERVDGLYPTPDGNVYLALFETHDGEMTFYARNDDSAIKYALSVNTHLKSIERIHFNYNKVYPKQEFAAGTTLNIPIGAYTILSAPDRDDNWGMSFTMLHLEKVTMGILLYYAEYPNNDWNIYVPEKNLIVMVPVKLLKEANP
jgi:hypothetical protein